jgi:RimJ/RimL family protein N-acetyltransferase
MQKSMNNLKIRRAEVSDTIIYFKWVNNPEVRAYSYSSEVISWEDHVNWFSNKINDPNYIFFIFENSSNEKIGQVRFEKIDDQNYLIGVSVASEHRGKGYGSEMLKMSCAKIKNIHSDSIIHAYIKIENNASTFIFEKAGFLYKENLIYNNFKSLHYIFYANK